MTARESFSRARRRLVEGVLGVDLAAFVERSDAAHAQVAEDAVFERRRFMAQIATLRAARDDIPGLTAELAKVRASAAYAAAFREAEPLVTVRIHSYTRTQELIDVALASVFRQSYERLEVVIVNDGPNPATRKAVEGLRDPRIRYSELPERGSYPADLRSRWWVAGCPAANRAIELAKGTWLAPLDDDDEFSPDHIEKLLAAAKKESAELSYGALIQKDLVEGTEVRIWSDPPSFDQFSFQGSLYLGLLKFFRYDEGSWMLDEPADWNLIRRMKESGVRMTSIEDLIGTMNFVPVSSKSAD